MAASIDVPRRISAASPDKDCQGGPAIDPADPGNPHESLAILPILLSFQTRAGRYRLC